MKIQEGVLVAVKPRARDDGGSLLGLVQARITQDEEGNDISRLKNWFVELQDGHTVSIYEGNLVPLALVSEGDRTLPFKGLVEQHLLTIIANMATKP